MAVISLLLSLTWDLPQHGVVLLHPGYDHVNGRARQPPPKERRRVLPSMAMSLPLLAMAMPAIQRRKQASKASGSIREKTRPKVSWLGTPWGRI